MIEKRLNASLTTPRQSSIRPYEFTWLACSVVNISELFIYTFLFSEISRLKTLLNIDSMYILGEFNVDITSSLQRPCKLAGHLNSLILQHGLCHNSDTCNHFNKLFTLDYRDFLTNSFLNSVNPYALLGALINLTKALLML